MRFVHSIYIGLAILLSAQSLPVNAVPISYGYAQQSISNLSFVGDVGITGLAAAGGTNTNANLGALPGVAFGGIFNYDAAQSHEGGGAPGQNLFSAPFGQGPSNYARGDARMMPEPPPIGDPLVAPFIGDSVAESFLTTADVGSSEGSWFLNFGFSTGFAGPAELTLTFDYLDSLAVELVDAGPGSFAGAETNFSVSLTDSAGRVTPIIGINRALSLNSDDDDSDGLANTIVADFGQLLENDELYTLSISGSSEVNTLLVVDSGQIPEPTTLALMGLGLAGVGFSRRKTH